MGEPKLFHVVGQGDWTYDFWAPTEKTMLALRHVEGPVDIFGALLQDGGFYFGERRDDGEFQFRCGFGFLPDRVEAWWTYPAQYDLYYLVLVDGEPGEPRQVHGPGRPDGFYVEVTEWPEPFDINTTCEGLLHECVFDWRTDQLRDPDPADLELFSNLVHSNERTD